MLGIPPIFKQPDSCLSEYNRNLGLPVDFPLGEDCGQRVLSLHAHLKAHTELLHDGDVRDQNRLRSLSLPHATAFLHAPSNFYTGTGMTPREFRLAVKWVLGLPIVTEPFLCPTCFSHEFSTLFDVFGDHALSCQVGGSSNCASHCLGSVCIRVGQCVYGGWR